MGKGNQCFFLREIINIYLKQVKELGLVPCIIIWTQTELGSL